MIIEQTVTHAPETNGPLYRLWHGYWSSTDYKKGSGGYPKNGESLVEASALISVIRESSGHEFRFLELGAGWGRQSLAIAGIIDNLKIGGPTYKGIAVEAEPQHYQWLVETIRRNSVPILPLYAAVSGTCDWAHFKAGFADTWYGQSLNRHGELKVAQYNLDYITGTFGLGGGLDLIHMDVQSAEVAVLKGGAKTIAETRVIYIGLHNNDFIDPIIALCPKHKATIVLPKDTKTKVPGFKGAISITGDGIVVLERK